MAKSLYSKAVSFRRIATVEQLQLEYTHTQSALLYPSCGYASRHKVDIGKFFPYLRFAKEHFVTHWFDNCLHIYCVNVWVSASTH